MKISDLIALSFHNLMLHKVRSLLTSLGIIFGVGSVIAMLAISEGAKQEALSQIESMGIDKVIVSSKKPPASGKNVTDSSSQSRISFYGLTESDLRHISSMDNVQSVATARNSRTPVLRGITQIDVSLFGVTIDFLEESRSRIVEGRWLNKVDGDRNTCVIGTSAKRTLFPISKRDVVGETIFVGSHALVIVGVLENVKGTIIPGVGSPNSAIFITRSASDALYGNSVMFKESGRSTVEKIDYDTFLVHVADISCIDDTARRISRFMEKAHEEIKDWEVFVPLEILRQREATQNIFTIVMSSIAGISLLVGGIGIMNIMLANVYERKKEIGTRRALGALKQDIILQFLLETVFLTSVGGIAGVGLGVGIAFAVTYFAVWPVIFSSSAIILSLAISAVTGIVFGTYPAWKAAQQNPIDVLRSE